MYGKIKFILYGNVPSLKNSKIIITKPYPRLISNPRVIKWTNEIYNQLKNLKLDKLNIDYDISIKIKVWRESRHKADVDNMAQTIFDSLFNKKKGIKVILDDSLIKHLEITNMGLDKANPRAEIEIEKYVDNKY